MQCTSQSSHAWQNIWLLIISKLIETSTLNVQKYFFRQIFLRLCINVFETCHDCNNDILAYNNKPKIICTKNKAPYQIWKLQKMYVKQLPTLLKLQTKRPKTRCPLIIRFRPQKRKNILLLCCCSSKCIWTTIILATEQQNEMCQITEHATRKETQVVLSSYRWTDGWTDEIHVLVFSPYIKTCTTKTGTFCLPTACSIETIWCPKMDHLPTCQKTLTKELPGSSLHL